MSTYPPTAPSAGAPVPAQPTALSDRSFIATWMFSWLLGFLGVDRFYLGKVGTGIVKLLTLGGLGIWWLIDLILTLAGVQRDKEGRLLPDFEQHKMIAWIITARGSRTTRVSLTSRRGLLGPRAEVPRAPGSWSDRDVRAVRRPGVRAASHRASLVISHLVPQLRHRDDASTCLRTWFHRLLRLQYRTE